MDNLHDLAKDCRAVHIEVQHGDLHLVASDGATWTLEQTSSHSAEPHIAREGDVLTICQHGYPGAKMDLRLTLPRGLERIEAKTGMGNIEASGLHGEVNLTTGHGNVTLEEADGNNVVSSGNGRVAVRKVRGSLVVSNGNGALTGSNLHGQITLSTGNGRIEVRESDGELHFSTGNGEISVEAAGGSGHMQTGQGRIQVQRSRALSLTATTGAGAIAVSDGTVQSLHLTSMMGDVYSTAHLLPGQYELESSMGAVSIGIPWGMPARVNAQTSFGKVSSDIPLVRVGRSGPMSFGGERMVGSVGEGDPVIDVTLRSSYGKISVVQSERPRADTGAAAKREQMATPSMESTQSTPSNSQTGSSSQPGGATLKVLESLARGEITAAQAEDLLYGMQRG